MKNVTAGVVSVETSGSRPSGQAPATAALIGTYLSSQEAGLIASNNSTTSSEMVLHMLDTLVSAHEPFYADYPSYQESETLSHPQHQHQQPHSIPRSTVMPPVSLDATTHTPGTSNISSSFFLFLLTGSSSSSSLIFFCLTYGFIS